MFWLTALSWPRCNMNVSIVDSSMPSIFQNRVDVRCRTDVAVITGIWIWLHTSIISLYPLLESTDCCVNAKRKSFFGLMPASARLAPSASIAMAFSHSRGNKTGTRVLPFPIMNVMAYFSVIPWTFLVKSMYVAHSNPLEAFLPVHCLSEHSGSWASLRSPSSDARTSPSSTGLGVWLLHQFVWWDISSASLSVPHQTMLSASGSDAASFLLTGNLPERWLLNSSY